MTTPPSGFGGDAPRPRRRFGGRRCAGAVTRCLRRLVDAGAATPARISDYSGINARHLTPGDFLDWRWVWPLGPHDTGPAHLYEIGALTWGDYLGDALARSNQRALVRDFPDRFVHLHGYPNAYGLAVLPTFADRRLTAVLLGLVRDDPLYDEADHDALTAELVNEAWPAYLGHDVAAMLRRVHHLDIDAVRDDTLHGLFTRCYAAHGDAYAETAVRAAFPSLAAAVADMAAALQARGAGSDLP